MLQAVDTPWGSARRMTTKKARTKAELVLVEMRGSPLAPRKANRFVRVLPYSELRSAAKKAALWLFLNALGSTPPVK